MEERNEVAFRTILMALGLLAAVLSSFGQQGLSISGRFKIEGGDLQGARVVVMKDGQRIKTLTTDLHRFTQTLELNGAYELIFEKPGFVSKRIHFDTRVPAPPAEPFRAFEFAVSLFKQYDDVNIVVFDQPVGRIRFDAALGDFDYDTDYTKSIQSRMQEAMAAVERKQKEEAKARASESRQRAAGERSAANAAASGGKAEVQETGGKARWEASSKSSPPPKAAPKAVPPPPPPPPPAPPPPPPVVADKPVRKPAPQSPEPRSKTLAPMVSGHVERPELIEGAAAAPPVDRHEELIVSRDKVIMLVTLSSEQRQDEYRKVTHKWGGTYFFKNGQACSREVYEREAFGEVERLAGATRSGR